MAPVGVQGVCHPDAELASARAAKKLGIPYIMSTAASRSIEEVAKVNEDGIRWFQLYWLAFSPRVVLLTEPTIPFKAPHGRSNAFPSQACQGKWLQCACSHS